MLVADGSQFDVWHPEYLGQNPSGRMITIGLDDDSFVTLDLLLVAGVHKGIERKHKNGRGRK